MKNFNKWMKFHLNDPYVKLANMYRYRARSAFKLIEILDSEKLLNFGNCVVDIGSAPGSWAQVIKRRLTIKNTLYGKIFAIDHIKIKPIMGVKFIHGDFNSKKIWDSFSTIIKSNSVNLVLSDISPNISGIQIVDSMHIHKFSRLVLKFACLYLKQGGSLIAKTFHCNIFFNIIKLYKQYFKSVMERKPKASIGKSSETFLVAKCFNKTSYEK